MRLPLVLVSLLLAASVNAAILEVEGPQDSLAGPPSINHCTLRKAVINANKNGMASPHAQCLAGTPGTDTINFLFPGTITFALAGLMEEDAQTGDLDILDDLIINGHPDGTIIDGADLDRIFDVKPGVSLTACRARCATPSSPATAVSMFPMPRASSRASATTSSAATARARPR